jgi:hypothetical protein
MNKPKFVRRHNLVYPEEEIRELDAFYKPKSFDPK